MTGCNAPPVASRVPPDRSPTRKSHTQIPPSRPPVQSTSPSYDGSHATHFTVPECPCRTCSTWSSDASVEMRTVWSPEAVARSLSDGDHLTSKMPLACGVRTVRGGSQSQSRRAEVFTTCTAPWSVAIARRGSRPDLAPGGGQRKKRRERSSVPWEYAQA